MNFQKTDIPDFHSHRLSAGAPCLYNLLPPFQLPATPHLFLSAGLHPWYIDENWLLHIDHLRTLVSNHHLKAIGETGLDTLRGPSLELQTRAFEAHVVLAKEQKLPLILHAVRTHHVIITLLKKHQFTGPVIFHGFHSSWKVAKPLIDEGHFLSIGKAVLNASAPFLETLCFTPLSQLLIETDDTQTPIREIFRAVARFKQIPEEKLLEHLLEKFYSFFG
ncbi:MAG: TatD family hydrolase [Bacteroidales bacterium]